MHGRQQSPLGCKCAVHVQGLGSWQLRDGADTPRGGPSPTHFWRAAQPEPWHVLSHTDEPFLIWPSQPCVGNQQRVAVQTRSCWLREQPSWGLEGTGRDAERCLSESRSTHHGACNSTCGILHSTPALSVSSGPTGQAWGQEGTVTAPPRSEDTLGRACFPHKHNLPHIGSRDHTLRAQAQLADLAYRGRHAGMESARQGQHCGAGTHIPGAGVRVPHKPQTQRRALSSAAALELTRTESLARMPKVTQCPVFAGTETAVLSPSQHQSPGFT